MSVLRLPAVEGNTVHGWLTAVGLTRVLAARWPELALRWDQLTPVVTGGPDNVTDAAQVAYDETIGRVAPGGVLPGCAPQWPPAGNKDHLARAITAPGVTPDWDGVLVSGSGLLHPLLRMHAAQTPRGVLAKMVRSLTGHPELMAAALTRVGLDDSYTAGLWLVRHDGEHPMASPGRDWLAIQALPWMPAWDVYTEDGSARVTAAGWQLDPEPVLTWALWQDDVRAVDIPDALATDHRTDHDPVFGAHRPPPPSLDRYRPPYMISLRPGGGPLNALEEMLPEPPRRGRGRPARGKVSATYRLSPDIRDRIRAVAETDGVEQSELVEEILRASERLR